MHVHVLGACLAVPWLHLLKLEKRSFIFGWFAFYVVIREIVGKNKRKRLLEFTQYDCTIYAIMTSGSRMCVLLQLLMMLWLHHALRHAHRTFTHCSYGGLADYVSCLCSFNMFAFLLHLWCFSMSVLTERFHHIVHIVCYRALSSSHIRDSWFLLSCTILSVWILAGSPHRVHLWTAWVARVSEKTASALAVTLLAKAALQSWNRRQVHRSCHRRVQKTMKTESSPTLHLSSIGAPFEVPNLRAPIDRPISR